MQTWNHLAWRRDAKAVRHFCLSSTSGGSLTDSVSIGRWNKKTRYSLTKGFFCLTARGEEADDPYQRQWRGEDGEPPQTKATLPVQVHNSKDRNLQVGGAFGSVPNPSEVTFDNKMG